MKRWLLVFTMLCIGALASVPALAHDTVYYYYTDTLHSAVVVTDASGNVLERTYYAPYGQVLNRSMRDGSGYTWHEEDPATGLNYMQQRYYDPQSGRFLSTDPVLPTAEGGNFNRYWYAIDNPYRYTDPTGRSTTVINGSNHTITLYSSAGVKLGTWPAFDHVDSHDSIGKLVNGVYPTVRSDMTQPHLHPGPSAEENGSIGPYGIVRFSPFKGADNRTHSGVGIHADRRNQRDRAGRSGPRHATNGCIRTTDQAMERITQVIRTDPLTSTTVVSNRQAPPPPPPPPQRNGPQD